jgi:type II secretory pathway component PulF
MPRFYVKYVARDGRRRTLKLDAVDLETLTEQIEKQYKAYVIDIRKVSEARRPFARKKISGRMLLTALDSLELMLATGVRINTAVRKLADHAPPGSARSLWTEIVLRIEETGSFGRSLQQFPGVFNESMVGVIMAHEAAGSLTDGIRTVRDYVAQIQEIKRESLRGALYPVLVCTIGVIASVILCIFTLPRFSRMLSDIGVTKTNHITAFFFAVSKIVVGHPGDAASLFCLPFAGLWLITRPRFKPEVDHLLLRLPILRSVIEALVMARVCATFRALSRSGVRVVEALETCASAAGNTAFASGILRVVDAVRENATVGVGFERAGIFSPEVVLAVKSGEGCLPDVFGRLADYYTAESKHRIDLALRLVEPVILMFVLAWVFGIALGVTLPVVEIINEIH